MTDVPLARAMLCYSVPFSPNAEEYGAAKVVVHPDLVGLSDGFDRTVGACFASWKHKDKQGQLLQLMIDAWHAAAFDHVPAETLHKAMLVIPEYRDTLAEDCLPREYQRERI